MEAHLTPEDRTNGWRIPAYDNGTYVGEIHLILYEIGVNKGIGRYYSSARFVPEKEIPIHDQT